MRFSLDTSSVETDLKAFEGQGQVKLLDGNQATNRSKFLDSRLLEGNLQSRFQKVGYLMKSRS